MTQAGAVEEGDSWHGAVCLGKEVPGTAWCV